MFFYVLLKYEHMNIFMFFFCLFTLCRVLLQVQQSVWFSETLSCPWTRPQTCTCSCTCPQTESQVQVTCWSHVESTQDLGFGKCWNGTSSVGPQEGQLISISPPWCLFIGARFNRSWQLKQSCHSLKEREWKCVRRRILFTEMLSVGSV